MNNELIKLTANQVGQRDFKKAILALGSCEAHGKHLACGTDTLISYKVSCRIANEFDDMLVLPPLTVGYSRHYQGFPFTLSLSYDTVTQVIYEMLESTIQNGVDRIFIMNGHDGNIAPLEIASRRIREKYPEAKIAALADWWVAAGQWLPGLFEVWDGMGHAGEGESSVAYYLYPEWNEPDLADVTMPNNLPEGIEIKWLFDEITDNALTGDATKASAEKGEKIVNAMVKVVSDAIKELDAKDWNYKTTK